MMSFFATSFGSHGRGEQGTLPQYPDVAFEHATGFMRGSDNIATFSAAVL